jgi:deoxyadenosine/deoxycytidine kinase
MPSNDRGSVVFIEGGIGAGKSTAAQKLAGLLQFRVFHEPIDAEYLDKFYKNPKELAFEFQLRQLARREAIHHLAQWEAISQSEHRGSLLDRSLLGDHTFAALHHQSGNISTEQWITYELLFQNAWGRLFPPSLLVFLDVDPEVAMERIRNRNRGAEAGMSIEYLKNLRKGYLDLISTIESREYRWCETIQILRVPWNTDHLPIENLANKIKDKLRIK